MTVAAHLLIPNPAASIKATIWATAEPGTGIFAASAAILRPLFRKIYADVREKMSTSGNAVSPQQKFSRNGSMKRRNRESAIELTSIDSKWDDDVNLSRASVESAELGESPYGKPSTEQARTGVGKVVLITAGQMVRTVPVVKK